MQYGTYNMSKYYYLHLSWVIYIIPTENKNNNNAKTPPDQRLTDLTYNATATEKDLYRAIEAVIKQVRVKGGYP